MKEALELFERFQEANQNQYKELAQSVREMVKSVNDLAISVKITEDRRYGDNKRFDSFEKRLDDQGRELAKMITKVDTNTLVRTGAVGSFAILITAFASGLATAFAMGLFK